MNSPALSVDETARRQFESDWRAGHQSSIDSYLPTDQSQQYLPTLEELVCIEMEFLWAEASKDTEVRAEAATVADTGSRPTYVEDYISRFPKLRDPTIIARLVEHEIDVRQHSPAPPRAEEYQRRFPTLDLPIELFSRLSQSGTSPQASPRLRQVHLSEKDLPRWFGGYHLKSILGKGGMATVYRASQHGSDRDVAVKIAQPPARDGAQEFQQRFINEAKAASRLTHDNVAPVFDIGQVNGLPFYTMPILNGGDLSNRLRDGPLKSRDAAVYLRQAALGVQHAHVSGVLHRDLKPSNLMVDHQRDRILVADFGLASEIAAGEVGMENDTVRLTHSGQILGTPPYMAPEQVSNARKADARSDVYSLGATLYHLIVGRPPFQASTPTETLHQVLNEEPVSPRRLNTTIDRDMDTIVMKCLEKEPSRRYQSADELAEDLDRFVSGRPIIARPVGTVTKISKWCKRNKRLAIVSGLLIAASLFAVIATLASVQAEQRRAENNAANSQAALQMLEGNYSDLLNDPYFANQPGFVAARRQYLQTALGFYERFSELSDDAGFFRDDVASAHMRLGDLNLELDGPSAALAHFQTALKKYELLDVTEKSTVDIQRGIADAHNGIGRVHASQGDYQKALERFEIAGAIRSKLFKADQQNIELGRKHANTLMNQGVMYRRLNRSEKALKLQLDAQKLREDLLSKDGDNRRLLRDRGIGEFALATLYASVEELDQAIVSVQASADLLESLAQNKNLHDGQPWLRLARCKLLLSTLADVQGDQELAVRSLKDANELAAELGTVAKYRSEYREALIPIFLQGVRMLLAKGMVADAVDCHRNAETLLADDWLPYDRESDAYLRHDLIHESQKGIIAFVQGDKQTGRKQIDSTLKRWESLQDRFRNDQELIDEMKDLEILSGKLDV